MASPYCPYGFLSMTLIVKEKRERPIPKGGIETQSIAQRQHSNLSLLCEPLEWASYVEFRPAQPPTCFSPED